MLLALCRSHNIRVQLVGVCSVPLPFRCAHRLIFPDGYPQLTQVFQHTPSA